MGIDVTGSLEPECAYWDPEAGIAFEYEFQKTGPDIAYHHVKNMSFADKAFTIYTEKKKKSFVIV